MVITVHTSKYGLSPQVSEVIRVTHDIFTGLVTGRLAGQQRRTSWTKSWAMSSRPARNPCLAGFGPARPAKLSNHGLRPDPYSETFRWRPPGQVRSVTCSDWQTRPGPPGLWEFLIFKPRPVRPARLSGLQTRPGRACETRFHSRPARGPRGGQRRPLAVSAGSMFLDEKDR